MNLVNETSSQLIAVLITMITVALMNTIISSLSSVIVFSIGAPALANDDDVHPAPLSRLGLPSTSIIARSPQASSSGGLR